MYTIQTRSVEDCSLTSMWPCLVRLATESSYKKRHPNHVVASIHDHRSSVSFRNFSSHQDPNMRQELMKSVHEHVILSILQKLCICCVGSISTDYLGYAEIGLELSSRDRHCPEKAKTHVAPAAR